MPAVHTCTCEIRDRCYFRGCDLLAGGRDAFRFRRVSGVIFVCFDTPQRTALTQSLALPGAATLRPLGANSTPRSSGCWADRLLRRADLTPCGGCYVVGSLGGPDLDWESQHRDARRPPSTLAAMRASRRTHISDAGHTHPRAAFLHINPGHPDYLFTRAATPCSSFRRCYFYFRVSSGRVIPEMLRGTRLISGCRAVACRVEGIYSRVN